MRKHGHASAVNRDAVASERQRQRRTGDGGRFEGVVGLAGHTQAVVRKRRLCDAAHYAARGDRSIAINRLRGIHRRDSHRARGGDDLTARGDIFGIERPGRRRGAGAGQCERVAVDRP